MLKISAYQLLQRYLLICGNCDKKFQLSPVDKSHFNFRKDIIIRSCLVDVYRLKRNIPKKGTGMNVSAMINMHSTWPKNLMSGIREKTKNMKILSQYIYFYEKAASS